MTPKNAVRIKELTDEELKEYARTKFVNSGFIEVHQWRNFTDYLQILLRDERKKAVEIAKKEILDKLDELIKRIGNLPVKFYKRENINFEEVCSYFENDLKELKQSLEAKE